MRAAVVRDASVEVDGTAVDWVITGAAVVETVSLDWVEELELAAALDDEIAFEGEATGTVAMVIAVETLLEVEALADEDALTDKDAVTDEDAVTEVELDLATLLLVTTGTVLLDMDKAAVDAAFVELAATLLVGLGCCPGKAYS
jgi:hypothetical protein